MSESVSIIELSSVDFGGETSDELHSHVEQEQGERYQYCGTHDKPEDYQGDTLEQGFHVGNQSLRWV